MTTRRARSCSRHRPALPASSPHLASSPHARASLPWPHAIKEDAMKMRKMLVVFDAADVSAESAFWAGVLDGTVQGDEDWHDVVVDGKSVVAVQHAPDHVPPDWPDGNPQQIH